MKGGLLDMGDTTYLLKEVHDSFLFPVVDIFRQPVLEGLFLTELHLNEEVCWRFLYQVTYTVWIRE